MSSDVELFARMKIVVFGAAGRTGRNIVEQALGRGHQVTAFIHMSEGIEGRRGLLEMKGDVLDRETVEKAITGEAAVLSALGRGSSPTPVTFLGTKNIVDAMMKAGVQRLVVESAFGAGESVKEISILDRFFVRGLLLRSSFRDKDLMEQYVERSSLKWTIVRPSRLTNGPRERSYRAGERISLNIASGVSRADVADFMLDQLETDEFVRKKPSIVGQGHSCETPRSKKDFPNEKRRFKDLGEFSLLSVRATMNLETKRFELRSVNPQTPRFCTSSIQVPRCSDARSASTQST